MRHGSRLKGILSAAKAEEGGLRAWLTRACSSAVKAPRRSARSRGRAASGARAPVFARLTGTSCSSTGSPGGVESRRDRGRMARFGRSTTFRGALRGVNEYIGEIVLTSTSCQLG
jgi:hypothetical protein